MSNQLQYSYAILGSQIGSSAFDLIYKAFDNSDYINEDDYDIIFDDVPERVFFDEILPKVAKCLDQADYNGIVTNTCVDSLCVESVILLGREGYAVLDPREMSYDPFRTLLTAYKQAVGADETVKYLQNALKKFETIECQYDSPSLS